MKPSPDWSQVRETVRLLELAARQIEGAMKDGDASIETLARSFAGVAGRVQVIAETAAALPGDGPAGSAKQRLAAASEQVGAWARETVIAFQSYDRLIPFPLQSLNYLDGPSFRA